MRYFNEPKKKHTYVVQRTGRYNYFNPKEEQVQYSFQLPHLTYEQLKEMDIKTHYILDLEKEFDTEDWTALEVASELKRIIDDYWINTDKDKIKKLYEYLQAIEEQQEKLREEYEIELAQSQVTYWTEKLNNLTVGRE